MLQNLSIARSSKIFEFWGIPEFPFGVRDISHAFHLYLGIKICLLWMVFSQVSFLLNSVRESVSQLYDSASISLLNVEIEDKRLVWGLSTGVPGVAGISLPELSSLPPGLLQQQAGVGGWSFSPGLLRWDPASQHQAQCHTLRMF